MCAALLRALFGMLLTHVYNGIHTAYTHETGVPDEP